MNDLELPIIKNVEKKVKALSMDDYLEFVQFNLQHTHDEEAYQKWKKLLALDVPFVLK
ncbi:MAG: hypothetical protein HQK84_09865 [Nitrospinae bacterium]|nr:hypothetical protein [Nitrospinota bacterium]